MQTKILFLSYKALMDHRYGGVVATMDYLKELAEDKELKLMVYFPIEEFKNKENQKFFQDNSLNYREYKCYTFRITPRSKKILEIAKRFFQKRYHYKLKPLIKSYLSLCLDDCHSLLSLKAYSEIEENILNEKPDYIILDEIRSVFMLPPKFVLKYLFRKHRVYLPKLIYWSYNIESRVCDDLIKIKPEFHHWKHIGSIKYRVNSFKIKLIEQALFKKSDAIICISPVDCEETIKFKKNNVFYVPPKLTPSIQKNRGQNNQTILFIGSPWPPNFFAAKWLCSDFAVELFRLNSKAKIIIGGLNAEELNIKYIKNTEFLGFISDCELEKQLLDCSVFVSPVIHGSGTKMKLMTALKYSTPIAASDHSLQGFNFLNIKPLLFIDNPIQSAQIINNILINPALLHEMQDQIDRDITGFLLKREGLLSRVIKSI